MNKKNYLILGILLGIAALVMIIKIIIFPKIIDRTVISIADTSEEAQLLSKLVQSQNKIADCIDEVAEVYQQQGIRQLTPEIIAKTKKCKSSVKKEVVKINKSTYLVKYIQDIPEGCGGTGTVSNLLNVEVVSDVTGGEIHGSWQSGITFSDTAIQDIEKSLEFKDCESFAQYIGSHGTLK